jgi:hypothetical protein
MSDAEPYPCKEDIPPPWRGHRYGWQYFFVADVPGFRREDASQFSQVAVIFLHLDPFTAGG